MKKFILSLIATIMTIGAMSAESTLHEARIYINPGHGSWGPNDRPTGIIPYPEARADTNGFFESNTNLWKGLKLRQTLLDWGCPEANLMISRVKNGPYPFTDANKDGDEDNTIYNKGLTTISREANSFNADYFLSIHSDAGSGTLNVALFIYNGYDTPAYDPYMNEGTNSLVYQETSRAMCETTWPYLTNNGADVFTHTTERIRGDLSFYYHYYTPADNTGHNTGYLGVLRVNTCNGFLSEGYCHTYLPNAHRCMNPDYSGMEGVRLARGIGAWFGFEGESKGYIVGSVKNLHERLEHVLYNYAPGSADQWYPINGATAILYKGGEKVGEYKTDDMYNGIFVFEKLEPGDDYTIDVVAPGFKSVFELDDEYGREHQKYSVKAHETTYPFMYLEASDYQPAPCYNYPVPDQAAWLLAADKYEMRKDIDNKAIAALEGKTIRRELAHGDSLYVLALDAEKNPYIYIINSRTQELYAELSTAGVGDATDERELMKISDIAFTSDSILVACNLEDMNNTNGTISGTFRVYKWEKDLTTRTPTGEPKLWFETSSPNAMGNWYDSYTGQSLAINGRMENCTILTTAERRATDDVTNRIRIPMFKMTRKGYVSDIRNQDNSITKASIGDDYNICISPRDDQSIIIDGSKTVPMEWKLQYEVEESTVGGVSTKVGEANKDMIPVSIKDAHYFKYGKAVLMLVPTVDADGKNTGVALYNVTSGLDKAKLVETTNTEIAAAECSWVMVSSHVEDDDITIYLNKDNTVTSFTTIDVEQDSFNNVYAYALKAVAADGNYTFTFKANEDCLNGGKLKFYDVATGTLVGEIALDNVVAGENSKVVAANEIPGATEGQELKWAVEVSSNKVTHIMPLLEKEDYALNRAYVTVDKSPESDKFGYIYVSDQIGLNKDTNGVVVYDQNFNRLNTVTYNGGIAFGKNGNILTDAAGNVYVTDTNVGKSGIWLTNSDDWSFFQFFGGARTNGVLFQNGVEVGGPTSSAVIEGSGADAKLYAYQKNSAGKYVINVYNVGQADGSYVVYWAEAPSKMIGLPAAMKEDASIVVVKQGIWVSQTIETSSSNKADSPALMFVDNDGNITFNSAENKLLELNMGSAITLSDDEKTLVVNGDGGILHFFDVTWNGNTPTLTLKYTYEHEIGIQSKKMKDGECIEQMAFDPAGRLVASGHYLGVFTIPTENNVNETPAKYTITAGKASVAIESVGADANAPVEYYNLQGIKVAKPENGVFIKKQGNKATKVIL